MTPIQTYLMFNGRCAEAIEFYCQALGAEKLMSMTFGESPDQSMVQPENKDKIMHAEFRLQDSTIMCSDGHCDEASQGKFEGFALTFLVANPTEAQRAYARLAEGGQPQMPLTETFFSPSFGMLRDRFGITWMVLTHPKT